tara:strand:+ start:4336 stop:5043 length:708 start_codon:yes stop_codon:yes gene_type:complete
VWIDYVVAPAVVSEASGRRVTVAIIGEGNNMLRIGLVLGALLAFSSSVVANESSMKQRGYVLGGVGLTDFNVTTSDLQTLNTALINLGFSSSTSSTDNAGTYVKLHGGYHVNEYFAVEGGFTNLGTLEINTTLTGPSESIVTSVDIYGVEIAAIAKYEVKNSFGFIKAGFFSWDADLSVNTSRGSASTFLGSGTDPTIGVGWQFGGQLGVRVEYQYYPVEDSDLQSYIVSGVYTF